MDDQYVRERALDFSYTTSRRYATLGLSGRPLPVRVQYVRYDMNCGRCRRLVNRRKTGHLVRILEPPFMPLAVPSLFEIVLGRAPTDEIRRRLDRRHNPVSVLYEDQESTAIPLREPSRGPDGVALHPPTTSRDKDTRGTR